MSILIPLLRVAKPLSLKSLRVINLNWVLGKKHPLRLFVEKPLWPLDRSRNGLLADPCREFVFAFRGGRVFPTARHFFSPGFPILVLIGSKKNVGYLPGAPKCPDDFFVRRRPLVSRNKMSSVLLWPRVKLLIPKMCICLLFLWLRSIERFNQRVLFIRINTPTWMWSLGKCCLRMNFSILWMGAISKVYRPPFGVVLTFVCKISEKWS